MKIAVCGYNFSPETAGIGRYTGEMCEWLARRGHDVRVVTSFPYYPWWRVLDEYRGRWSSLERPEPSLVVRRARMLVPTRPTGLTRMLQDASFAAGAAPWLAGLVAWRPDAVIAVCPPLLGALPALALARASGAAFVVHVQDLQVDAALELGLLPAPMRRALVALERAVLASATRVSTISAGMAARIEAKRASRFPVALVPNWSSVRAPGDAEVRAWRERHGFSSADRVVLYAGNLGQKQGLDVIPRLAAALRASRPDARVVVAGDGAMRPALEAAASAASNVRLLPLQPEADLAAMLGAADAHLVLQKRGAADLVLPSKLTNILAVGGAAVVTCEPGTSLYEFAAGGAVMPVPPEDDAALIAAVEAVVAGGAGVDEVRARARAFAAAHLERDAILDGLVALLERSAARPARRGPAGS